MVKLFLNWNMSINCVMSMSAKKSERMHKVALILRSR